MTRKKHSTRKVVPEAIGADAGDTVQEDGSTDENYRESTSLQQQLSQMKEHSSRLISEYNKRLDKLQQENKELKETLQLGTSSGENITSTKDHISSEEDSKLKAELEGLVTKLDATTSELEEIRRSYDESLVFISLLKNDIADLNEKLLDRDRIIEEAKSHLSSLELTSEHLSRSYNENSKHSCDDNLENENEDIQEKQDVQSDGASLQKTGLNDSESTILDIATSSSSTGTVNAAIVDLLQAKKELEELISSERKEYEEKLALLRNVADLNKEDKEVIQKKYVELNVKYDEVIGELQNARTAYSNALVEVAATHNDNDELVKSRDGLLERIKQCESEAVQAAEESLVMEENIARLSEENASLLEKLRRCEERFHSLQENEAKTRLELEEASWRRFEIEKHKLNLEKEELLEKIEDYGHTINFLEVDQSEKRQMCEELAERCRLLEENLNHEKAEHRKAVEMLSNLTATRCEHGLALQDANEKVDELQRCSSFEIMEQNTIEEENKRLKREVSELEETIKSAEEDLEATRSAFANQVNENHRLKAELANKTEEQQANLSSMLKKIATLEQCVSEGRTALADVQLQCNSEIEELRKQLAMSNAVVDTLTAQLEASRKITVEEVDKQAGTDSSACVKVLGVDKLAEEREKLAEDLKRTKEQLCAAECELSEALRKCGEIEEEKNQLHSALEIVKKSEESLSRELWAVGEEQLLREAFQDELTEKNTELSEEIKCLEAKVSDLEARNNALTEELAVFHENEVVLMKKDQELKAVISERDDLLQRNNSLDLTNREMHERLAANEFDCQNNRERCASLEVDLLEAKKVALKVDDLNGALRLKEEEIISLRNRVQLLEEELLAGEVSSEKLNEEIDGLTKTLADRNTFLARSEAECAALRIELAEHSERVNVTHVQSSVERKRSEETITHLRDDNVRLEKELFFAHEQLESTRSELAAVRQSLEHSEALTIATRNENQRLVEELERAMFEREQTFIMAGEGKEAAARVLALERSIAQLKAEHDEKMEQALGDLEASKQRLRVLNDKAEQAVLQRDDSMRKMESWRERFELAAQEVESLTRANGEVRNLEAALEQSRSEKNALYQELTSLHSYVDRVVVEKDALLAQLTTLNGQLDERTNRLRQAGEAKMDTTLRIVELESQIAALLRERDNVQHSTDTPSSSGAVHSVPTEHVAVQIESGGEQENTEIDRLRMNLIRAERRIAELEEFERIVGDSHGLANMEPSRSGEHSEASESSQFISASTPFPSLVTLLSRRVSALRRRPQRALLPYFRYALAGYVFMLHMMVIHCWFLAGCP